MKLKKGSFTKDKLAALFGFKNLSRSSADPQPVSSKDQPLTAFNQDHVIEIKNSDGSDSFLQDTNKKMDDGINNDIDERIHLIESEENIILNAKGSVEVSEVIEADPVEPDFRGATMGYDEHDEHDEHDERLVINYSDQQLAVCKEKLADFMRVCVGAYGAMISTVDGHELVYLLERDLPAHKISTMNSSLLALGETIARESFQRLCQFVILENSDGRVVSLRINELLMLTCISTAETNLGMLLSLGRNTASALKQVLNSGSVSGSVPTTGNALDNILRSRMK